MCNCIQYTDRSVGIGQLIWSQLSAVSTTKDLYWLLCTPKCLLRTQPTTVMNCVLPPSLPFFPSLCCPSLSLLPSVPFHFFKLAVLVACVCLVSWEGGREGEREGLGGGGGRCCNIHVMYIHSCTVDCISLLQVKNGSVVAPPFPLPTHLPPSPGTLSHHTRPNHHPSLHFYVFTSATDNSQSVIIYDNKS